MYWVYCKIGKPKEVFQLESFKRVMKGGAMISLVGIGIIITGSQPKLIGGGIINAINDN